MIGLVRCQTWNFVQVLYVYAANRVFLHRVLLFLLVRRVRVLLPLGFGHKICAAGKICIAFAVGVEFHLGATHLQYVFEVLSPVECLGFRAFLRLVGLYSPHRV